MKPTLPTNYVDDIPNPSVEGMRRYQMIYNSDNTVSFKDVTPYDQTGSDFGAGDINLTNEAVNQSADAGKIIDDPDTAEATTEEGYIAGVQLFNHVNESLTADNSQAFQFAYDSATQKYGYKVKEADTEVFVPFKSNEINYAVGTFNAEVGKQYQIYCVSGTNSSNSSHYNAINITGAEWVSEKEVYIDKKQTFFVLNSLIGGVIKATANAVTIITGYDTVNGNKPNIILYYEV